MRKLLVIAGLLVALDLVATGSAAAATVTGGWQAKLGTAAHYGTVTLNVYATGTGAAVVKLKGFAHSTAVAVGVYQGTCAKPGSRVLSVGSSKTTSSGAVSRTVALLAAHVQAVAAKGTIIRAGTRCGVLKLFGAPFPAGSSRANPVKLGQAGRAGDWLITVTDVTPDAWPLIQAANMFNDPPEPGRQFFMIAVTATYKGAGSDNLDSGYVMRAVGAGGVGYTTFDNSCGVLPAPNLNADDPEVFTGGTVSGNAACWEIASADASSLVMYVDPFLSDTRIWFALR